MQENSVSAYHNLNRHKVGSQTHKIIEFMQKYPSMAWSDRQIAYATRLPINIVQSRRHSLDLAGEITFAGDRHDPATKNWVRTWKAKMP